jgi:hypothetical protein
MSQVQDSLSNIASPISKAKQQNKQRVIKENKDVVKAEQFRLRRKAEFKKM